MLGIFNRWINNWTKAGGAFDRDLPNLCMIIARGDRQAEAVRDGSEIGESYYHLFRAVNDIVFVCAEQIAGTRTFCEMTGTRFKMNNDLFHPFVLAYIYGLSRWVFANRIPGDIQSSLKINEENRINSSLELLYGESHMRALSVLESADKTGIASKTGYDDGAILVPRMRDEAKTDGVKRLAIFLFH